MSRTVNQFRGIYNLFLGGKFTFKVYLAFEELDNSRPRSPTKYHSFLFKDVISELQFSGGLLYMSDQNNRKKITSHTVVSCSYVVERHVPWP